MTDAPTPEQEARRQRCVREFDQSMIERDLPVTWIKDHPFVCRKHPTLIGQVVRQSVALHWSVFRHAWALGFAAAEGGEEAVEAPGRPALRLVGDEA